MKFCTKCGAKLVDPEAKFCGKCGAKIFKEESSTEKISTDENLETVSEENIFEPKPSQQQSSEPKADVDNEQEISAANVQENSTQEIFLNAKKKAEQNKVMEEYLKKKAEILNAQKNSSSNTEEQTQTQNNFSQPVEYLHVLDENFHDLFLKRDGRLNRLRFFKRTILSGLITVVPIQFLSTMILESSHDFFTAMKVSIFLMILGTIANMYLNYGLLIRRSHDFPKDSLFADIIANDDTKPAKIILALNLVSAVLSSVTSYYAIYGSTSGLTMLSAISILLIITGGILGLYFLFKKGEVGANKFGPDPLGPAVYPNDPRAYNPENETATQYSQSSQEIQQSAQSEQSNLKKNKNYIFAIVGLLIVVVLCVSLSKDSSKNYTPSSTPSYKRTSDNSDYQRNQSSAKSNSNSPSNYNFQFHDNDGNSYNAVSNYREAFGIIQIDTSKEIYCNFDKNPRARGMFHNVRFAVSNGTNEPIFIGDVYLIDDRGRKYAADINATVTHSTMMHFEGPSQINPGQAVVNFSIFDIPDNVNITKVRYEEMFEQPIEVPYQVSKN